MRPSLLVPDGLHVRGPARTATTARTLVALLFSIWSSDSTFADVIGAVVLYIEGGCGV
jgi:hypothetical protein